MLEKIDIENRKYIWSILQIVLLFSLATLAMLPANIKVCLSWFTGTVASTINFLIMAYTTFALEPQNVKSGIRYTSLAFFLRYAFLLVWSLVVIMVFHVDLLSYCVGLFTTHISVFLYQAYFVLRYGKIKEYFRGNDE